MAEGFFCWRMVADRITSFDLTGCADDARCFSKFFYKGGFAAPVLTDESDIPNGISGVFRHN